jgi:phosphate transport system substrate-binding protein
MREFSNRLYPAGKQGDFGKLWNAGDQMMDALAADKYGITYTSMQYRNKPSVKTVPLAWTKRGPYVYPTLESVQDRSYPLTREVYFYTNRPAGGKVDPLIAEYLRFIVSRQGQELVQKDGKYLPLTRELAQKQIEEIARLGSASSGGPGE